MLDKTTALQPSSLIFGYCHLYGHFLEMFHRNWYRNIFVSNVIFSKILCQFFVSELMQTKMIWGGSLHWIPIPQFSSSQLTGKTFMTEKAWRGCLIKTSYKSNLIISNSAGPRRNWEFKVKIHREIMVPLPTHFNISMIFEVLMHHNCFTKSFFKR